jgi:hypothetical protein
MTGAQIQATIHDLLFYDGWIVLRVNQGGSEFKDESTGKKRFVRFGFWSMIGHDYQRSDGISDLMAFKVIDRCGVLLAIEVKGRGDTMRAGQVDFLEAAAAAGAIPIVARDATAVDEWISERVMVQ